MSQFGKIFIFLRVLQFLLNSLLSFWETWLVLADAAAVSLQDLAFATIHHGEIANPRADDDDDDDDADDDDDDDADDHDDHDQDDIDDDVGDDDDEDDVSQRF